MFQECFHSYSSRTMNHTYLGGNGDSTGSGLTLHFLWTTHLMALRTCDPEAYHLCRLLQWKEGREMYQVSFCYCPERELTSAMRSPFSA